ncbi:MULTISPECIES: hypothetical protein [unclassified Streptomyces]|uniref:TRAFAC clade GTPase domain-containing protein n=1 Tax=unclassified Streptomyces TaxID=2593676 RepID=UPI003824B78B
MRVPRITLTMLGATGSGKTTFLHGMYATLSSGIKGYFLYASDPDVDLDLAEAWEELCEDGTLPQPTAEVPTGFDFRFLHGVLPLLEIDCMDFRGGAGTQRGNREDSPADVAMLRSRIAASDAVLLILDGQHVARWIADGAQPNLNPAADPMKIARFSRAINGVIGERLEAGEPAPSLVVVVTKADLLSKVTGMSTREALTIAAKNLGNLVPVAVSEGVSAMLCPVQLGTFNGARETTVDPGSINPKNLHNPVIFALLHYLTEGITRHEQQIRQISGQIDDQSRELAGLSSGAFGGLFKRSQIQEGSNRLREWQGELDNMQEEVREARRRAELLAMELRHMPIYRSGKLQEG